MLVSNIKTFLVKEPGRNIAIGWRYGGKPFKTSTGTRNVADAKSKGQKIFDNWAKNFKAFKPMRDSAWLTETEKYIEDCLLVKNEESTLTKVRDALRFLQQYTGVKNVTELTREKVKKAVQPMIKARKWAPKTWMNRKTDMSAFCKYLVRENIIPSNPFEFIPNPPAHKFKKKGAEANWPDSHFKKVFKALPVEYANHLYVMRMTGMDPADLAGMELKHIFDDHEGLSIIKKRQKAKNNSEIIKFPIVDKKLEGIFRDGMEIAETRESQRLFTEKSIVAYGSNLWMRIMRLQKKIEVPHRDVKGLRHTFINEQVKLEVGFDIIREWIGHSPKSRTLEDRYLHRDSTRGAMTQSSLSTNLG